MLDHTMSILEQAKILFDEQLNKDVKQKLDRWSTMAERYDIVEKGGAGSGHYGHSGRPGKVGGSSAGIDIELAISKTRQYIIDNDVDEDNIYVDMDAKLVSKRRNSAELKKELGEPIRTEYLLGKSEFTPYHVDDSVANYLESKNVDNVSLNTVLIRELQSAPIKSVALSDVVVTQRYVFETPLRTHMQSKQYLSSDMYLLYSDGNYFVHNNNHRVIAAIVNGEQTIDFRVLDISNVVDKEYTRSEKELMLQERTNLFNDYVNALSEQVYTGDITLGEFQEMMKRSIREFHTGAAAIAKGGFENMGPRDWGRLGTPLREQYKWLNSFVEYIGQNKDTISLRYIQNRARLYGQGAIKTAVLIETPFYIEDLLPWLPKDGQSECLNKCHCRWVSELLSTVGNWSVYKFTWLLGQAEHCGTCVSRNGHVETLRIPIDVTVPEQIGGY